MVDWGGEVLIPPNNEWLYDYYSGVPLKVIELKICRGNHTISDRINRAGLPKRPRGQFTDKVKAEWLARVDVKMLQRIFKNGNN